MSNENSLKIYSGDQSLFSSWDSIIKLEGFNRNRAGYKAIVSHQFHLIDGLGRSNLPEEEQFGVTNEFFRYEDGKEIQPSWFAVSDVMPFLTLETMLPRRVGDFIEAKFDVFAKELPDALSALPKDDQEAISQTTAKMGFNPSLPANAEAVYKKVTESNWFGIVDKEGNSASSYTFDDIERHQYKLMMVLYRSLFKMTPPESRQGLSERFRGLVDKGGVLYPQIQGKTLPEVAETTFRMISSYLNEIDRSNLDTVELIETTDYFTLPKQGDDPKANEKFKFFDWYIKNGDLYNDAHNKIAAQLSKKGENPIQSFAANRGETPFWIVIDGKKGKLSFTRNSDGEITSLTAHNRTIELDKPLCSHLDLADALYRSFDSKKIALAPTAIGLLFQMRASGQVLLPEKGSSYIPQANMVWAEMVRKGKPEQIRPLMQNAIIRVNPNALDNLPENKRVKLPAYVSEGFSKDKDGYISTYEIASRWRENVSYRKRLVDAASKVKGIAAKTRVLFEGTSLTHPLQLAVRLELLDQIDQRVRQIRTSVLSDIQTALKGNDLKRIGDVTKYLNGQSDFLPLDIPAIAEKEAQIEEARQQILDASRSLGEKKPLETALQYYAALRLKMIEGGAEALEYFNSRPNALSLYLLFGSEALTKIIDNVEVYEEYAEKEPIIATAKYSAEGNKILVVEDKVGWIKRRDAGDVVEQTVETLKKEGLDTAIIITLPEDNDADYDMLVLEKDGTFSNMCGNGVRAVARYIDDSYNIDRVSLRTPAGEIVVGHKQDGKYCAQLSEIKTLDDDPESFVGLVSHKVLKQTNPMDFVKTRMEHAGISLPLVDIKHILGEPHAIVEHSLDIKRDELGLFARKFAKLTDEDGNLLFPNGINVNFFKKTDPGNFLITFERGVDDFTGSCGTGAVCTAAEIFESLGTTQTAFRTPAGKVEIEFSGGHYRIKGGVEKL